MPFAYYSRLSRAQQAEYRRSDAIALLPIPGAEELRPVVAKLRLALEKENREATERLLAILADELCRRLRVPKVRVRVRGVRPALRRGDGELHGMYTYGDGGRLIEVWMRTARHARVVRFRTFLRTFLHEMVHHLDVERLDLPHSFHTEGFFKRESHLMAQLAPKKGTGPFCRS